MGYSYNPFVGSDLYSSASKKGAIRPKEGKITCSLRKEYISSPLELRDLQMAIKISTLSSMYVCMYVCMYVWREICLCATFLLLVEVRKQLLYVVCIFACMYVWFCMHLCMCYVIAFEARLDALMSYVTLPEVVHNSTVWLGRVKMHMDSERVPIQTQVSYLICMYVRMQ